jgi:outer membrane scaffolding protein for murein synthesis (MipA/OmpV family)
VRAQQPRSRTVTPAFALLAVLLLAAVPRLSEAQTPSPLQEWQYTGGIILQKLFQPDLPEWRVVLGAAADFEPKYDGALAYRWIGGPVINIRYYDKAFFSVGEGLGYNFLRGKNYEAGVALGYDLGRRVADDYPVLRGMGDINPAPFVKLFGSYVISKNFPLVLRADVRQILGGADGTLADFEFYMPMPGSSESFFWFAGPSITFASGRFQQKVFGVTHTQSVNSGYAEYDAHPSANAAGVGVSLTKFITKHVLFNADLATNRLLGSSRSSPLTLDRNQGVIALSFDYHW